MLVEYGVLSPTAINPIYSTYTIVIYTQYPPVSPVANNTTRNTMNTLLNNILYPIELPPSSYVSMAYNIQMRSGCRASEVLALQWADIFTNGDVYIKSTKRGVPHIVRMPDLSPIFAIYRGDPSSHVIPITYRKLYLAYRRAGINVKVRHGSKNNAVTHAPRHALAQQHFLESNKSALCAGHSLGHKSLTAIIHYLGGTSNGDTS